jgi:hypothetical protein
LGGWEWDGVGLAVGVGEVDLGLGGDGGDVLDGWEDVCSEVGLEFVHLSGKGEGEGEEAKEEKGRNEFGGKFYSIFVGMEKIRGLTERAEKTGIPRVLEALESNDWAQASGFDDEDEDEDEDEEDAAQFESQGGRTAARSQGGKSTETDDPPDADDLDPESLGFGFDKEDFAGLRKAIWSRGREEDDGEEETEDDVQKLEGMMRKLLAVRDMSAELPEEQRKKMAKKAVGEVMKDL